MQTWQLTVWFAAIMAAMFGAGCTFGYTYKRNKAQKALSNGNSRKR